MNNFTHLSPHSTQIHLGMPTLKHTFSSKTIHLFEPHFNRSNIRKQLDSAIATQGIKGLEEAITSLLKLDASSYLMSQIIGVLGTTKMRKKLLSCILDQSEEDVLSNSYMHDNGFEKWVLINNADFKLRLHVYEDTRLIPQENRHNHSWDFASYIIEGTLQNTIYEIDSEKGDELLHHYKYSPVLGDNYSTEFLEMVKLKKMTDINLSPNTAYFMPADVIHRISYEQTFKQRTITLMLTSKRKNYNCDLFSEHVFTEEKMPTSKFSKQELEKRFKELINN